MSGDSRAATDRVEAAALTVACYVRAPMLLEPVDAHVETLRVCEREGLVRALVLRSWPEEVRMDPDGPDRDVLDRVTTLREWADSAGVDVRPAFETRTRRTIATPGETEVLVLPLCCIVLYDEAGAVVGVYPHSADGETYTVQDAIATLRTGTVPVPLSASPVRVERSEVCPDCMGPLTTGQGVYACPDCGWAGTATAAGGHETLPPAQAGPAVSVSIAPGATDEAGDHASEADGANDADPSAADPDGDVSTAETEPDGTSDRERSSRSTSSD